MILKKINFASFAWYGWQCDPDLRPDELVDETLVVTSELHQCHPDEPLINFFGQCEPIPVKYEGETVDMVSKLATGARFPEPFMFTSIDWNSYSLPLIKPVGGMIYREATGSHAIVVEFDPDDVWSVVADRLKREGCEVNASDSSIYTDLWAALSEMDPCTIETVSYKMARRIKGWGRSAESRRVLTWTLGERHAGLALPRDILFGQRYIGADELRSFLDCSRTSLHNYTKKLTRVNSPSGVRSFRARDIRSGVLTPILGSRQGKWLYEKILGICKKLQATPPDLSDFIDATHLKE